MKRRSRAGREPIKGRGRKAPKPPRRNVPTAEIRRHSSTTGAAADVARLTHELSDAREQQAATSEVLKAISRSTFDLRTVLDTLLQSAVKLCSADQGTVAQRKGDTFYRSVSYGFSPVYLDYVKDIPVEPGRDTGTGRALLEGKVIHIADVLADPDFTWKEGQRLGGFRTVLGVPMLREGVAVGVLALTRSAVRPFSDEQIALVENFAAQAIIAIENARLLNELHQRTTDLTERTADLTEALEQQTATSDVLKVISGSPGDLQPVFDTMLANATRLCEATHGHVWTFDGEQMYAVAVRGDAPFVKWLQDHNPVRPIPGSAAERIVRGERFVHVADRRQEPAYRDNQTFRGLVDTSGIRASLSVALRKGETLLGMINVYRQDMRPFTDNQIKLVEDFATQAVIAIENARLLNELRQRTDDLTNRTADLTEALEQQTATSEVLQVISRSPGDLQPVFDAMLNNATRLCEASYGTMWLHENDGQMRMAALHGTLPEAFREKWNVGTLFRPNSSVPTARVFDTRKPLHVVDLKEDTSYFDRDPLAVASVDVAGIRSLIAIPMLKEGAIIGAMTVYRQEVRPFTDKQIALVQNFAAQAVIAIENARLLNELRQRTSDLTERTADLTEALEQQTATSEVLQVISSSPGDLEPVFAAMLENAVRICDANFGNVYRAEGDGLRSVATHNTPTVFAEALKSSPYFSPGPKNPVRRMIKTKAVVHVVDVAATEAYAEREPIFVASVELGDTRTLMIVPMLKDNELIGAFTLARQVVRPFTEKQIELVKNFAAQAVIAVENARLLNELRQSLEEQTATSDVLRVISSCPGELEPVFAAMLASATRICEAEFGNLFLCEQDAFRAVAWHGEPTYVNTWRGPALIIKTDIADIPLARLAATKQRVHVADLRREATYKAGFEHLVALIDKGGARTLLIVPMLKERTLVGAIAIYRQEVSPFTDKQIALVENFAVQAVIAIENARLLRELRERTQEVEKLNQHLEQRVTDQVGEIERMSRLRRFLPPQVADLIVASGAEKQLESHRREITALFCDLRGFTGFTESADAEDVMALLRDYHASIGEKIIKYNGTLERYAGDGVMVVFNDPVPVENPALQAVLMALEVRDALEALTATWSRLGHEIGFGIGIAHGFATLGTIGFEGRFDYAAIGTVSNVASRLCDEAKPGQILISPRVLTKVENAVKVEPVGEFELKGIRRPLAAYNVVAAVSPAV